MKYETKIVTIEHEPGPWELDMHDIGGLLSGSATISGTKELHPHLALATVVFEFEEDPTSKMSAVCRGNARLVAMAPTMFDILCRAQDHIEALDGVSVETEKLVDDLRALFEYLQTDVVPGG